jgi:hypothetical protein
MRCSAASRCAFCCFVTAVSCSTCLSRSFASFCCASEGVEVGGAGGGVGFVSFCANVIASEGGFRGAGTVFSTTGFGAGVGGATFSTTGFGGGGVACSTTGFGGGAVTAFSATGLGSGGTGFSTGGTNFSTNGIAPTSTCADFTPPGSLLSDFAVGTPPPSPKA